MPDNTEPRLQMMRRPLGRLVVNVDHPVGRFGQQVTFGVRGEDNKVWIAKVEEGGRLLWIPALDGTYPHPTLYLADDELIELERALRQMPVRYKGDASVEHLSDAVQTRDTLLRIHEKELERHHEQVMAWLKNS